MGSSKSFTLLATILALCLVAVTGCQGPAGPQGPKGEQGAPGDNGDDGDRGQQGEAGPGAKIINFTLSEALQQSGLSPGNIISTPVTDTIFFEWAAQFDTTFHQAVADTEFVLVYADLPGRGFSQLPVSVKYVDQSITDFAYAADQYSYRERSFFFSASTYSLYPRSLGNDSREVYGAMLGSNDGYAKLEFTNNKSQLSVRSVVSVGLDLYPNTDYGQEELISAGTAFPLDSDLSTPGREDYITTDGDGAFLYEATTDQLGAMKDTLGQGLELSGDVLGIFRAGNYSDYRAGVVSKNPLTRRLQLVPEWSADSIRVTAYMDGLNAGSDHTAYVNNFPVEIKVVIVGGNPAAKAKRKQGRMPYTELQTLLTKGKSEER